MKFWKAFRYSSIQNIGYRGYPIIDDNINKYYFFNEKEKFLNNIFQIKKLDLYQYFTDNKLIEITEDISVLFYASDIGKPLVS